MQPTPQPQPQYAAHGALSTKRGLLKYILLGLITFGIYDIWQMSEISTTINLIATRRDGKKTMHYCLMFFLIGWLTLGIGWLVWYHKLSDRIGTELASRRIGYSFGAADFWLWNILGSFIIVGPFVYMYKLLKAMNLLAADYNQRG
ncbi:DUF4234 domain-containing protein [Bifidobacterium sp. SO1]|uniref:DUF4234 domain-containing protein n=1 Tax=Bifidobacterium sp. SO1 TaxID=2809029 RepID=UPI003204DE25